MDVCKKQNRRLQLNIESRKRGRGGERERGRGGEREKGRKGEREKGRE